MSESRIEQFRSRIGAAKNKRRELLPEWQESVDYRRGKPFEMASDEDRVAVNFDWSQTKAKQAQLFSQVPEVMLTPKHQAFAPAVPVFATLLNDTLTRAKVGTAMDEVLPTASTPQASAQSSSPTKRGPSGSRSPRSTSRYCHRTSSS
jgi:hypothetical protein